MNSKTGPGFRFASSRLRLPGLLQHFVMGTAIPAPWASLMFDMSCSRGALSRGVLKAEQDAAPARAGGTFSLASGRPGVTVRANYVALPSMAGRGQDEGGRKPARSRARYALVLSRKHGPPDTNRREWSAVRRRASFRQGSETPHLRLAALHAPRVRGAQLTTQLAHGARAIALGCLTTESGIQGDARRSLHPRCRPRAGGDP